MEQNKKLFDSNYNPLFECIPRNKQIEGEFSTTYDFIPKNDGWKIKNSFFFREEYLEKMERNQFRSNQCLETDWTRSNLSQIIKEKDGKEELKIVLKNVYSNVIDTYVSFASQTIENDRFVFTKNILLDFCLKSGIISQKTPSYEEINAVIISLMKDDESMENFGISKFSLQRYQFLEFLVKISHLKFSKNSKAKIIPILSNIFLKTVSLLFLIVLVVINGEWRNYGKRNVKRFSIIILC